MKYEYIRLYFRIATYHTARKISSHFPQFGSDWFALPTQFAHQILTTRRSAQTFARGKTIVVLREGVRLRPGDLGAGNRTIGIFSDELCARARRCGAKSVVPSRDTQIAEKSLPSFVPPPPLPDSRVSAESHLAAAAAAPPQSEDHSAQGWNDSYCQDPDLGPSFFIRNTQGIRLSVAPKCRFTN